MNMNIFKQPIKNIPIFTDNQYIFNYILSLKDFEIISKLGNGCFATVFKVKYNRNGLIYALKQYNKEKLRNEKDIDYIMEKSILYDITQKDYPNIVKLYADFEDNDTINLVMEYVEGINLKYLNGNDNQKKYVHCSLDL